MDFKYTREAVEQLLWPKFKYEVKPPAPIPRILKVRGKEYDVVELYLQITRSEHISFLAKFNTAVKNGQIKSAKNPFGAGRPMKYSHEDRLWMAEHSTEDIMERYGHERVHARVLKFTSKKYVQNKCSS